MLVPAALGIALLPTARENFYIAFEILHAFPKDDIWEVLNFFGDGTGIALFVAAIWILRRDLRRTIGVLLIALLVCGTVVETIKWTTWRIRPRYGVRMIHDRERWEFLEQYIAENPDTRLKLSSDDQWLWWDGPRPWGDDFRSFPSGHAAAAIVFAIYLAHIFPRGRAFWWVLGVMGGLARVEMRRHYIEDMLVGVSVGWISARATMSWAWPVHVSERTMRWLEELPRRRSAPRRARLVRPRIRTVTGE